MKYKVRSIGFDNLTNIKANSQQEALEKYLSDLDLRVYEGDT